MRWSEWRSKLADHGLVTGVAAVAVGLTWTSFVDVVLIMGAVAAFLAFGYDLNDRCDFSQDLRAGKPVGVRPPAWRPWSMAVLAATLLAATTPSSTTSMLAVLALGFGAGYSVRPLRLKERGLAGIVAGALAQRTLPAGVLVTTLSLDVATASALLVWTVCWGARAMIVHQATDAPGDRQAGVRTWARDRDRRHLGRVALLLGLGEVLSLTAAVASGIGGDAAVVTFVLSAAISAALAFARSRRGIPSTWVDFASVPLYDGYTVGIPVVVAVLLVLETGAAGAAWAAFDMLLRGRAAWAVADVFLDRPELDGVAAEGSTG